MKPWVSTVSNGARVVGAHAREQRGLEPAAVLVAALEVHRRGTPQLGPRLEHARVRDARLEPDVEDVGLRRERRCRRNAGTPYRRAGTRSAALVNHASAPSVANRSLDGRERLGRGDGLAALHAFEHRDRHAPRALAADAPVGTIGDHRRHAVDRPAGNPLDPVDLSHAPPRAECVASIETNHWSVARKMTGCLQRQQCG